MSGLHDDTRGGAAEGEADWDHGGALLVPALGAPVVGPLLVPPLAPPLLVETHAAPVPNGMTRLETEFSFNKNLMMSHSNLN